MPTLWDYKPAGPLSIDDLVASANALLNQRPEFVTNRRTVRFYISEGVLPPPDGPPKLARYTLIHLSALVALRIMIYEGLRLERAGGQVREWMAIGTLIEEAERLRERALQSNELDEALFAPMAAPSFAQSVAPVAPSAPKRAQMSLDITPDWNRLVVDRAIRVEYAPHLSEREVLQLLRRWVESRMQDST